MNLQHVTPELLNIVARKAMIPLAVMVVIGGGVLYAADLIAQSNDGLRFEIDAIEWQIDENTDRIANIEAEVSTIRDKSRQYDEITEAGFFGEQERLSATQLLERLAREHDLTKLNFKFEPQTSQIVEGESDAKFELIQTQIAIEAAALTDYDVMGFVAEFAYRLEGQVQVPVFTLKRMATVDDAALTEISRGAMTLVFDSVLEISWNNLRSVSSEQDNTEE